MFNAEIINEADKLNAEIASYKNIPVLKKITQQGVLDNYYQVKFDLKRLIEQEVNRLKEEKENTFE